MAEHPSSGTRETVVRRVAWAGGAAEYLRAPYAGYPEHAHDQLHVSVPLDHIPARAAWRAATGRQRHQSLGGDDICVIPAGERHNLLWEGAGAFLFLYLTPAHLATAAHDLLTGAPGEIAGRHGAADPFVRQLGATLRATLAPDGTPQPLHVEAVMNVLAVHLLRHYTTTPAPARLHEPHAGLAPAALRDVREYIAVHLAADVSLGALAAVCHLSPYHFARAFKRTTGQTPHAYVVEARVARARHLLEATDLPLVAVAADAGFGNQSHMTAQFRRALGVTPRRYRSVAAK